MEHTVSEIVKYFTTMMFILLLFGFTIMGKHLTDVNGFKDYVNVQIERNGGYTANAKENIQRKNEDDYGDLFGVYEVDSNDTKAIKNIGFGEVVDYEIHANIPVPFTAKGTFEIPIKIKGEAISRVR